MGSADATTGGHAVLGIATGLSDTAQVLHKEDSEVAELVCRGGVASNQPEADSRFIRVKEVLS